MPLIRPSSRTDASADSANRVIPISGVSPLTPRLADWMRESLADPRLFAWIERWGSPLNLHSLAAFGDNVRGLQEVAAKFEAPLLIQFARKANKCLSFVAESLRLGCGVDVASQRELEQAITAGLSGDRIVCTAAIKERPLLELCAQHGVTAVVDNADELALARIVSTRRPLRILLRVSGFQVGGEKLGSRFGIDIDEVAQLVESQLNPADEQILPNGLHFHLDGYSAEQRVEAISQSLLLMDQLRRRGYAAEVLDIGGGFPVNYLESADEWTTFWQHHGRALLGSRPPLTYRNHGLGLLAQGGEVVGSRDVYPFHQPFTAREWCASILASAATAGLPGTVSHELRIRGIQLRCEPGRALLDGCGMTVARVAHRKQAPSGDLLVGLAMNTSQCRTGSDDFMVDPLLITKSDLDGRTTEGYLTGSYCTEAEVLSLRKFCFSPIPEVGDLVAFPNTAGYFMHFRECQAHQFPLAKNVFCSSKHKLELDAIDQEAGA